MKSCPSARFCIHSCRSCPTLTDLQPRMTNMAFRPIPARHRCIYAISMTCLEHSLIACMTCHCYHCRSLVTVTCQACLLCADGQGKPQGKPQGKAQGKPQGKLWGKPHRKPHKMAGKCGDSKCGDCSLLVTSAATGQHAG